MTNGDRKGRIFPSLPHMNNGLFFLQTVKYILFSLGGGGGGGGGRAQWLNGRVLDSRLRGQGVEVQRRLCVVSLSKSFNPSLVLVQPRKTCPFITERLLMGRKESNQTNIVFYVLKKAHRSS